MINKDIKILICEDESIIAMDVRNIITRFGYSVVSIVKTARELLQVTSINRPDIIISDIKLKGEFTSLDALTEISSKYKIPVIFLSGLANAAEVTKNRSINPCYHISKPFVPKILKETIELCISGQHKK